MIALIAMLLALTPLQAREAAHDAAEELAGVSGRVALGHCILHGRFARCPARVYGKRESCRLLVHVREVSGGYVISGDHLECWRGRD